MFVRRVPCAGGFMYRVYVNDADNHVTWQGACFLRNVGWHPETNAFVSKSDDALMFRHKLIEPELKKGSSP